MIEHVYRRAATTPGVDAVIVATDDERIASVVQGFGGVAQMTRSTHQTGTDRVAEVAANLECDIIVNVQGDLPLIEPDMIAQAIDPLDRDPGVQMSTLRQPITDASERESPNVVKVAVDLNGDALYFSRSPLPYLRGNGPTFKHIGLYAYRRRVSADVDIAAADAARKGRIARTAAGTRAWISYPHGRNTARIS